MSKPWKQTKIFTADAEQSVIIEPNPERDGVCIHSNEELAIAEELINFVKLNQNKEDE